MSTFVRSLTSDTGVSVVWQKSLDSTLISLSVKDVTVRQLLLVVARRLGVSLAEYDNLYFLGDSKKTDRAVYVGRVDRLKVDSLSDIIKGIITTQGTLNVMPDGLVVVSDEFESIIKIQDVIEKIQVAEIPLWFVQFYVIDYSNTVNNKTGLDIDSDINISVSLADSDAENSLAGKAVSLLEYELASSNVQIVASPLFVLLDGGQSQIKKVETVPVPRYTTSNEGTVSVSGYDNIESGFDLTVTIRDWSKNKANLTYKLVLGEITGYVDVVPIVSSSELTGEVVVSAGKVYLLGALDKGNNSIDNSGFAGLLHTKDIRNSKLKIWAKVHKI